MLASTTEEIMIKSSSQKQLAESGASKAPFEAIFGVVLAAAWIGFIVALLQDPGAALESASSAAPVDAIEPLVPDAVETLEFGPPVAEFPSLDRPKAPVDYDDFGPPVAELPSLAREKPVARGVDNEEAPIESMQNG
jgi:hypothetical protein